MDFMNEIKKKKKDIDELIDEESDIPISERRVKDKKIREILE